MLKLTLKGKMIGWGIVGQCELGEINFANWRSVSTLSPEAFYEGGYDKKYFIYDVGFIPPKRKRRIFLKFMFDINGCLSEISINNGEGYFPKYMKSRWISILKSWLIENKYAEERE